MSKARAARRLAAAAAFGGGGLGLLGGSFYGMLSLQARLARKVIGPADIEPIDASGVYGAERPGDPIAFAMLGDSAAAGYGVSTAEETPGAMMAAGLSEICGRPVRLTCTARVGERTSGLPGQIERAFAAGPQQVAAVVIGANDVTHKVRPSESVRLLAAAVRQLRAAGCEVVVGTCPDLGTIGPILPPLRQVARVWSRRLAAAQTIAVVEAGARSVSLGALLGPEFAAAPTEFFGPDQFHPSATGYASVAAAMLPSLAATLGHWPADEAEPETFRGEGVLPISFAAAEAVQTAGTEVTPTQVAGRERGPRGRWALIRHRRRPPLADIEPGPRRSRRGGRDLAGTGATSGSGDTPGTHSSAETDQSGGLSAVRD